MSNKKRKLSKSQRAYWKQFRKKKQKQRMETNKNLRKEIEKVMNEGRKAGISYKKTNKNIKDSTHKNNISTVNAMFKELKINSFEEINKEKIMGYLEEKKQEYEDGDIKKGGLINNRIKGIQRFYDSVKVARGLSKSQKEMIIKNMSFVEELNDWKRDNKIVKSKNSSRYLKPNAGQQKLINDRFHYLRNSRPDDKYIQIASDYHRFAAAVGCRINQGINATLNNLEKLKDGRYMYIVREGEDKTSKPRIKFVENKNDIKFLDRLVKDAEARADRKGKAYLFELKINGDNLSRKKIKENIQKVYREQFKKYSTTEQVKVRYQEKIYKVKENFVPHSSRSISIQKELKTRALRYKRDPKRFESDLKEMIFHDISKGSFRKDSRGAIVYGYEQMRKKLGRELTIKETAMYLTSVSHGHNRIDVMRDHYFSKDMNEWFGSKNIK